MMWGFKSNLWGYGVEYWGQWLALVICSAGLKGEGCSCMSLLPLQIWKKREAQTSPNPMARGLGNALVQC